MPGNGLGSTASTVKLAKWRTTLVKVVVPTVTEGMVSVKDGASNVSLAA